MEIITKSNYRKDVDIIDLLECADGVKRMFSINLECRTAGNEAAYRQKYTSDASPIVEGIQYDIHHLNKDLKYVSIIRKYIKGDINNTIEYRGGPIDIDQSIEILAPIMIDLVYADVKRTIKEYVVIS